MRQLFSWLIAILCFTSIFAQPHIAPAAAVPVSPPDNWHAHPPIHVLAGVLSVPSGYTPNQLRHAYGFDRLPNDGTGQIIGIVDAFNDPTVTRDLQTFITAFGLRPMYGLPGTLTCTVTAGPHPCFQRTYAQSQPATNSSWLLETALDVEWAHAIASGADILLVESKTDSWAHLFGAVDVAVDGGVQVVSMSWGGNEFQHEEHFDHRFSQGRVIFTAASGDSGNGLLYPAASPYVLAVGGTTLPLDSGGNLTGAEATWGGSGGGISTYESEPYSQSSYPIPNTSGKRGVPDVSYDADPSTGVAVSVTPPNQERPAWFQVGGTSMGAPQWAALVALANQTRLTGPLTSSDLIHSPFYTAAVNTVYTFNYRDITLGMNGNCGDLCIALPGYDFVTGLGSPHANNLVPYLATH